MHKIYTGCINCTKYDSPFTCPEVAMALTLRPGTAGVAVLKPPAPRGRRGKGPP
jgi:hypothetical protein